MPESRKSRYRKRLEALRGEQHARGWRSHWMELADYILPRRALFSLEHANRGGKLQQQILDSTASRAAEILASGMMSGLTSPARPWFRLGSPDPELNQFGAVKQWLHDVQVEMERVFATSNLYNVLPSVYESGGVFGTACAFAWDDIEEDVARTGPNLDSVLRFEEAPIGSYYLATSSRGYVDTIYRELRMTARQLVQKFGLGAVSVQVKNLYERGDGEAPVDVVHVIEPNELERGAFARNKPFASCWYESGGGGDAMLRESGFDEFPGLVPRWYVSGNDVYGRSRGMQALPDVKHLQVQQRRKLEATELMTRPPRVGSKDVTGEVALIPAGVTITDAIDARTAMAVPFVPQINLDHVRLDIAEVQQRIRQGFFEDLFLMLTMIGDREVTATEIAERKEEKLLMLGPVLERLEDELLDPLIDRAFAVLMRRGRFLPGSALEPPAELSGAVLRVEYVSILAQAQRAVGTSAMDRQATAFTAIAPVRPDVLDKWNVDTWIDEYTERLGLPPKLLHTPDEVAEIRDARVRREQMAAMAEQAPDIAGAAKDLSEAELPGGTSALTRALETVGAA